MCLGKVYRNFITYDFLFLFFVNISAPFFDEVAPKFSCRNSPIRVHASQLTHSVMESSRLFICNFFLFFRIFSPASICSPCRCIGIVLLLLLCTYAHEDLTRCGRIYSIYIYRVHGIRIYGIRINTTRVRSLLCTAHIMGPQYAYGGMKNRSKTPILAFRLAREIRVRCCCARGARGDDTSRASSHCYYYTNAVAINHIIGVTFGLLLCAEKIAFSQQCGIRATLSCVSLCIAVYTRGCLN